MSQLTDKLKCAKDFFGRKPAEPDDIASAEAALGVEFAPEYRSYVAELGAATIHGHELTGVCTNKLVNVVDQTVKAREINDEISKDCYVVENTHFDGKIIWQNASGTLFMTQDGSKAEVIASSIVEYLKL